MSKEEKLLILQMVADGKITPEQGAELLRAVGDSPKPQVPVTPPAPVPPVAPNPPAEARDAFTGSLDDSIRRAVETSVRKAEEAAQMAARHAETFAQRIASEGENIGKVLGESGENLGKILGRVFGGGWVYGANPFDFHEEITGELPPEGELKVNLSTRNGKINIDTWDQPGFKIDVLKRIHASTEEEAKAKLNDLYEFKQDGLSISAHTKEIGAGFLGPQISVHFTLTLPKNRKADVQVNSANGRLTLEGLSGSSLRASTANGRIEARELDFGRAAVESANGRIEITGRVGDLSVNTANGRVEGDVRGAGDWVISTANGRIEMNIRKEAGAAYEVDASSVSGRVEVTGLDDVEVLANETRHTYGSKRYHARNRNYATAELRGSIKARTAAGKVILRF